MTDLAARLSALEARLAATCQAVYELSLAVTWTSNPEKVGAALSAMISGHLHSGPPSPPAAEGEAVPMPEPRIEDRWITEARQVYAAIAGFGWEITWKHYKPVPDDAWPIDIIAKGLRDASTHATPGPAPETIALVRYVVRLARGKIRAGRELPEAERELDRALRLLDAEPRETGP